MSEKVELSDVLDEIKRQNNWLKFQNYEKMESWLEELDGDEKLIFHHSDGETGMRSVAEKTSFSSTKPVVNRMKNWRAQGKVFKNQDGKWEHLAPLDAFGVEVPEPVGDEDDEE